MSWRALVCWLIGHDTPGRLGLIECRRCGELVERSVKLKDKWWQ